MPPQGMTKLLGYYLDFVSAPTLALILLAGHALCFGISPDGALLFLLGVGLWTLVEYWLHRLAHVLPWIKEEHFEHHEHPRERSGPSSFITTLVYLVLAFMTFGFVMSALLGGFLLGYSVFLFVHFAVHHFTIAPGQWLYEHKLRHTAHHRWDNVEFGVTTDLWDRVHGTRRGR